MINETVFCKQIVQAVKSVGAMTFNVHGHKMQASGWPDLQIYHPSFTGHVELKVGKNPASALQKERISLLKKLGTMAFVLRLHNYDDRIVQMEDEGGAVVAVSDPDIIAWRADGELLLHWFRVKAELIQL